MRFTGKVVLVTGAASGVGRVTALRFANEGATVFALDLNEAGLAETVSLADDAEGTISTRRCDISSRDDAHAAVAECVATHGRLDVVVNVAGVLRQGHAVEVTQANWDLVMGVNLAGTFWVCQAAIPHLLESKGNIVNIASNTGLMGGAYTALYSASKHAVVGLTRSLAMEFAKAPIRINAVAPGGIATPMAHGTDLPADADWKLISPLMGFRAMSEPEDIAAVILFVASSDAAAMHGSIVSADSGLTAG